MFVYRYLADKVEEFSSVPDEGEVFDPHQFRKLDKPTSYGETMMHMLKGAIGAGILAMPDAIRRVGLIYGVLGIMGLGLFATYALHILIYAQYELCKKWKRGYMAYPKSMGRAIKAGPQWFRCTHRFFYIMTDFMLVIWQLGLCAVYCVFVAVTLQQIGATQGYEYSVRMWIVYQLPIQLLCNLIKDLKLLTPLSSLSNFIILIGLILVFYYLIEDDVHLDDDKFRFKGLGEIPLFIGTTLFALEAAGVILALEYNMERPARFVGVCGLLTIGMFIILGLFVVIGVAGYLKYGDDVKASITLNLPEHEKRAQGAKLAFGLALFFSFPLQNFVAYQILWRRIKKKLNTEKPLFYDILLRIALVLIPFSMAIAVPNLGGFISLLGALCLSLVAFVFPAIMDACIWYSVGYGLCKYKLLRDILIIIFGIFSLVSGVYTSLIEISHSY